MNGALESAGVDALAVGASVVQVYLNAPVPDEQMRATLGKILEDVPGARVHKRDELPQEYRLKHETRTGDWVVVLPPPYGSTRSSGIEFWFRRAATAVGMTFGMHGYDPALDDMGGIFLAMGRGVPAGPLGETRQIDLPATVAALLDIEPPRDSEGVSIW